MDGADWVERRMIVAAAVGLAAFPFFFCAELTYATVLPNGNRLTLIGAAGLVYAILWLLFARLKSPLLLAMLTLIAGVTAFGVVDTIQRTWSVLDGPPGLLRLVHRIDHYCDGFYLIGAVLMGAAIVQLWSPPVRAWLWAHRRLPFRPVPRGRPAYAPPPPPGEAEERARAVRLGLIAAPALAGATWLDWHANGPEPGIVWGGGAILAASLLAWLWVARAPGPAARGAVTLALVATGLLLLDALDRGPEWQERGDAAYRLASRADHRGDLILLLGTLGQAAAVALLWSIEWPRPGPAQAKAGADFRRL